MAIRVTLDGRDICWLVIFPVTVCVPTRLLLAA